MNQCKKDNGWILCPSKSFPGKFYYFNVLNGETAWSLNEVNNSLRRDYSIQTITDKSHDYPEPNSPPNDESPNTSTCNSLPSHLKKPCFAPLPPRVVHNMQAPTFGQTTFQNYVQPAPYMPNIIWTPIQLPPMLPQAQIMTQSMMPPAPIMPPTMLPQTPMMQQPPMSMADTSELKREKYDHNQSTDTNRTLMVQTCKIPLSKRFGNYWRHSKDSNNRFSNTSTPIKNKNVMSSDQLFGSFENLHINQPVHKSVLKEPVFRSRTQSESNRNIPKNISKSNSLENLVNSDYISLHNSTFLRNNKVDNCTDRCNQTCNFNLKNPNQFVSGDTNINTFQDLDRNDLRFLLVAKRRKSVDLGELPHNSVSGKKIKISKPEVQKPKTKKKVTFDLGVEDSEESLGSEPIADDTYPEDFEVMSGGTNSEGLVYVVSDFETLLEDLECIEEYVQADDKRRLVISYQLRREVESSSRGDCGGRQHVMVARQVARKIVAPPPYYVILPEPENNGECSAVENDTLNCCLDIINSDDDDVVVITNNPELYAEAKSLNISCFKTQEIKDGAGVTKPEISFKLQKVQIAVNNRNKPVNVANGPVNPERKSTNLFLQTASEFESCMIKEKDQNPVKTFRKSEDCRIFKEAKTSVDYDKLVSKTINKPSTVSIFDANTALENLFINKNQRVNEQPSSVTERPTNIFTAEKNTAARFENRIAQPDYAKQTNEKQKEIRVNVNEVCVKNAFEFTQSSNNQDVVKETPLDKCLKMYHVENKDIIALIKLRIDEWICVFTQIMEDALVEILTRISPLTDRLSPPWVLYEAAKRIQELYGSHTEVTMVADKFRELLVRDSSQIGKLKASIKPNDFMKILGCGNILIQTLKEILPNHEELTEADISMKKLLQSVTQPIEDDLPLFRTPVLSRSEVDEPIDKRHNFIKSPWEIIEYLKKHYPQWRNVEVPQDYGFDLRMNQPKILRTFGRNLNMLNIDNSRSISIKNPTDNAHGNTELEINQNTTKSSQKLPINSSDVGEKLPISTKTANFESLLGNTMREPRVVIGKFNFDNLKIIRKVTAQSNVVATPLDDLNVPKHSNTFDQKTAGPKVIRPFENSFLTKYGKNLLKLDKINLFQQEDELAGPKLNNEKQIDALKENDPRNLDMDALDYDGIDKKLSPVIDENNDNNDIISVPDSVSFVYKIKESKIKKPNENFIIESNDNALNNDIDNFTQIAPSNDCKINTNTFTIEEPPNNYFMNPALNNDFNMFSALDNDSSDRLIINESTNDSGFENESTHAYSLVKRFLSELSDSFKTIYQFIDKTVIEFRAEEMKEEKKRLLHHKANTSHLLIADIIDKLECIIQRESDDGSSLKEMLLKAGVQASTDKRITRYRQVVMKCLEQARALHAALRDTLALAHDAHDAHDARSDSDAHGDLRYFNIFE